MSAIISEAAFEAQMEAAGAGLEEKIFYTRWHRADPTKSFGELRERFVKARPAPAPGFGPHGYKLYPCARVCGNVLELGGVCAACNKADAACAAFKALPRCVFCRAYKDSADARCNTCDPSVLAAKLRPPPSAAGLYECYICQKEGPTPACDSCRQAMNAYGAVQCVHCEAYWLGAFDGEWQSPCGQCHPKYRAAYAARDPAPVNEGMEWYTAKKKEWEAYADRLEAGEEGEEEDEEKEI